MLKSSPQAAPRLQRRWLAPSRSPQFSTASVSVGLILVLITVAYLPAIRGGMLWDDDGHITKPELRSLGGLYAIWFELGATQQYYPLLHSAFWLEHRLWGDSVIAYHIVNILLHAAAACLAYVVLLRLKIPGALLAAAIFAVHPVEVESVAWISEQKNTLSAVFYLSAMLAYLRFDQTRDSSLHFLALVLFTLGLLTKTVTATLPAALLVTFWWQRGTLSWRRDGLPLVPFFLLAAAAGGLTAIVERKLIGAQGAAFDLSIWQRGLIAGRAVWFYLGKLVWPTNMIFIYPRWKVDPAVWWQWLFPLAALAATAMLWLARKRSRAPLAAWLFFVGTLFPALGFLNVYPFVFSFVADHFQYLASLGMIALAAAVATLGIARLPQSARPLGNLACGGLVVALAVLTMFQSSMYGNVVQLYKTTLARNPDCWMADNNLGAYLQDHDRDDEGEPYLRAALDLRRDYPEALMNLGAHYAHVGRPEAAIDLYQRALEIRPDYWQAEDNWANALVDLKRPREAVEHYQTAARLEPRAAMPHYNLANTLRDMGDTDTAVEQYQQAIRLKPDFVEAHYNLGIVLAKSDKLAEAIDQFQTAVRIRPEYVDGHHNLGLALRNAGRVPEAIAEFQTAIRLDDNYFAGYADLAKAYAQSAEPAKAIETAEKAQEMARAAGQIDLADQIESWLTKFRATTPAAERGNAAAVK
ncbi:MAG TPA: tetratricopeptide repeat protein [Pirellulaceae bacterium]